MARRSPRGWRTAGTPGRNPWLDLPLADYEGHMALPAIAQASMIADDLASALGAHRPKSVAVVGCSGGNGFDRIDPAVTTRVVGIDLNRSYVETVRSRYAGRFARLELWVGDLPSDPCPLAPVDLVHAALVLEYVDLEAGLSALRSLTAPGGSVHLLLQVPTPGLPEVSPSPFPSLRTLAPVFRPKSPARVREAAVRLGLVPILSRLRRLPSGKRFAILEFRRGTPRTGRSGRSRLRSRTAGRPPRRSRRPPTTGRGRAARRGRPRRGRRSPR